jgi:hypothetical protein
MVKQKFELSLQVLGERFAKMRNRLGILQKDVAMAQVFGLIDFY